jgi:hypothetical protein
MSSGQRKMFAEKFADLGNLAAAGMVFGQFVLRVQADPSTMKLGGILTVLCYCAAYLLSE